MDPPCGDLRFSHRLCRARFSEKQAHGHFFASKEPWSSVDIRNRHLACYGSRSTELFCFECDNLSDQTTQPHVRLNLTLLRCCRQIYQDALPTIFSANTISFVCPTVCHFQFYCFSRPISGLPLEIGFLIRRLHLGIMVCTKLEEQRWIKSLERVTRDFKSLQYLYIDIEQHPYEIGCLEEWCFEDPAKSSFLGGLRMLRDLKLRAVTVTISDCPVSPTREGSVFNRWTMMQKQVWAAYVMRLLLRQEDQNPTTGEGI